MYDTNINLYIIISYLSLRFVIFIEMRQQCEIKKLFYVKLLVIKTFIQLIDIFLLFHFITRSIAVLIYS